jgi:hypothetical protein
MIMELDELRQGWKRSAERIQLPGRDIKALIPNKASGSVTELKNRFRRGMLIVPVIIAIALSRLPHHHGLTFMVLFSFLLLFPVCMTWYFYYNYKLVGRMQQTDITVRENLQRQVDSLGKGIRFRLLFTRGMFLVFIVLLEILMYLGKELIGWQLQNPAVRLAVYACVFGAFYLLTHFAVKHRYGKSISYLKDLVNQLE